MTTRQTIDTYNNTADWMAKKFDSQDARIDDIELAFSYLRKKSPRVVEVGCGSGRDAREILKRTKSYLGIDISEAMIRIARARNPKGRFLVADAEDFSFPRTDLIFAFASLLHSNKAAVKRVLDRARGSLTAGGLVFLSLKLGPYRTEIKKDIYGVRKFFYYTPELIKKLSPGFEAVYEDIQELRGQKWFTLILRK